MELDKINFDFNTPIEEICLNCSSIILTYTGLHGRTINCKNCNTTFTRDYAGNFVKNKSNPKKNKVSDKNFLKPLFLVGTKFNYRNIQWNVVGIVSKNDNEGFKWFEYAMFNKEFGFEFLVQVDYHYSWFKQYYGFDNFLLSNTTINFNNLEYRKFNKYSAEISEIWGEWPNLTKNENQFITHEYISPPFSLSINKENDEYSIYTGVYLPWKEVRIMFQEPKYLPKSVGKGASEPLFLQHSSKKYWSLVAFSIILLCLIQLIISISYPEETVILEENFNAKNKQEIVSFPFEVPEKSGIVNLTFTSNINNSWISYDAFIVNEKTGEKFGFQKETEYYFGNEGGEHWIEGSQTLEQKLTGVAGGVYRLVIQPEFDDGLVGRTLSNQEGLDKNYTQEYTRLIGVSIVRQNYSMWNFWVIFLFLIIPYIILKYYQASSEKSRWMNSNFYSEFYDED